jgi:hypothetical protein
MLVRKVNLFAVKVLFVNTIRPVSGMGWSVRRIGEIYITVSGKRVNGS